MIWVYVPNDAQSRPHFAEDVRAQGCILIGGGLLSPDECPNFVRIDKQLELAAVSLMVWVNGFQEDPARAYLYPKGQRIARVDYYRLMKGEEDYRYPTIVI